MISTFTTIASNPYHLELLINRLSSLRDQSRRYLLLATLIVRANIVSLENLNRGIHDLEIILTKVENETVTFDQAIKAARHIYFHKRPLEMAIHLACQPTWSEEQSVIDYLLITGLVDKSDIERLGQSDSMLPSKLAAMLVSAGVIESCILQIATRLRYFVNQGIITFAQSLSVLSLCRKHKIDVDNVVFNCLPNDAASWKGSRCHGW
jgi:hypothetical protein